MEEESLPNDIANYIACKLKVPEICAMASTCSFWKGQCSTDSVWFALAKKRWPGVEILADYVTKKEEIKSKENGKTLSPNGRGWRVFYMQRHKKVAQGVDALVEFITKSSNNDSIEVRDYDIAMELIRRSKLRIHDIEMYLLQPKHGVLVNLIGLHYCISWLGTQKNCLKDILFQNQISNKKVCLRWWVLGQWVNGFPRDDEMNVCKASLVELLQPEKEYFLNVIECGIVHEVLRVQISADFRTSA